MKAHLVKTLYAEAAHRNPHGGEAQQRLHGHSYCIEILASGTPQPELGWVVDFAELKQLFDPIYRRLDHAYLNDIPELSDDPTLPMLRQWIMKQIGPKPDWLDGVRVSIVGDLRFEPRVVPEDDFIRMPERLRFTFEAAQSLPQLPAGHPCQAIHGHSYRIEVGAREPEKLEDELHALYNVLDHRYLNEIAGLEQATCERICQWVWDWLTERGNRLMAVAVQETAASRSIYYGE